MDASRKLEALLLTRRGLVFAKATEGSVDEAHVDALELEIAQLGYVLSTSLRARLEHQSLEALVRIRDAVHGTLAAALGADRKHEPLFRRFPHDVPSNTRDLWLRKVLSHYLQGNAQPCIFCGCVGTCFVLEPCRHVVCGNCYDGANYSACPVCERHVNRDSPFFQPSAKQAKSFPSKHVRFKRLDLGEDLDAEARALFVGLCNRKQALSPDDSNAFSVLIETYRETVLTWLPATIPVKENVAMVFGSLLRGCDPNAILPVAARYIGTATDVLRILVALSGADLSLQGQRVTKPIPGWPHLTEVLVRHRFKMAKMGRPLRRTFLRMLENFDEDLLVEDMLRHATYWVWVGEFLHPHEYADRYPRVARAFGIVRKKGPDGNAAPPFRNYYSHLDEAFRGRDFPTLTKLLRARPGELARRFDHALRIAGDDEQAVHRLVQAFADAAPSLSTPVLLTLRNILPTRVEKAKIRIYWPKDQVSKGVSSADRRPVLTPSVVASAVRAIEAELLRRFGTKPAVGDAIVDEALRHIPVPFNERTASRSAVSLPRGSRIDVPRRKIARLALHWCEPEVDGQPTDVDLSVGLYDADWNYVGVCSYYELTFSGSDGTPIAVSAGDLRDAPYPNGATEFIDVHRAGALEAGIRYAVMVVNNYAGMPFRDLERGFAALLHGDDAEGEPFDAQEVALKFDLQGDNGVYLPLVFDLETSTIHWLDTYAKGQFQFNCVETSKKDIRKICPELITYFESGVRMSMYELALLHAAARAQRVFVRGESTRLFIRRPDESALAFLHRLTEGEAPASTDVALPEAPRLAVLYRGDIPLPPSTESYALFRELPICTLAASDLIA
ncbi:hypothetical protein LVJ94_00945 [Pendulispora rubella]|uniref:RING-type domain-containing protein n=1 Tax=Pendulispora rubella TaxID=2741070 RepID=A0ABZ2L4F1_9BACT